MISSSKPNFIKDFPDDAVLKMTSVFFEISSTLACGQFSTIVVFLLSLFNWPKMKNFFFPFWG